MRIKIPTTKEVNITHVLVTLPVRYEEEDIPNDFPLRKGETWEALINIDTGQIGDWPKGKSGDMYMKVCDEGIYRLIDNIGGQAAEIDQDYVPHGLIPGEYGDYVFFKIDENGVITNWPKKPNLKSFFKSEE